MSYNSSTDFIALLRRTSNGVRLLEMPGLDYVIAGMSRAGMFRLWSGQMPPLTNAASTVWLKTALPSWSAEASVMLWNAETELFEPATPELWAAVLLQGSKDYVFQAVASGADNVDDDTTLLAIERSNPATTVLTLPLIGVRKNRKLQIVDFSDAVTDHVITLNPSGVGTTIMRRASWQMYSTADQLSGLTLQPSIDLNAWVVAP